MPLQYQWYYECDIIPGMYFSHMCIVCMPILTLLVYVGKNKSFYSIFPVTKRDAGIYYCQVKNQYGKVDSEKASLVVLPLLQPTKSSPNCFCNKGPQIQNVAALAGDLQGMLVPR